MQSIYLYHTVNLFHIQFLLHEKLFFVHKKLFYFDNTYQKAQIAIKKQRGPLQ